MRSRARARLAPVVLLVVLTATTGCTPSRPTSARPVPARATPSASGPSTAGTPPAATFPSAPSGGIVLAVDRYTLGPARQAYLAWAGEVATAQCVRAAGYDVPQPRMPTSRQIAPAHDRRYGVTSATDAATFGYHLPAEVEPSTTDPYAAVPAAVLDGGNGTSAGYPVPAGGCRGATAGMFAGAQPAGGATLASAIDAASYPASLTDPRLRPVFADWSTCMAVQGFSFAGPDDAIDTADLTTPSPSSGEIATATADVGCKTTTHLVGRWSDIESDLETGPVATGLPQLQRELASATAALAVARRVTGVAPPS